METLKYIGIIIPILFLILGLEYYLSKRKGLEVYTFSDTIVNICCGMLERLSDFFFIVVFYYILGEMEKFAPFHLPDNILPFLGSSSAVLFASGTLKFILTLLVADWAAYWHHRKSHEINIMWASHIVHHQSEELNITTVFRVSGFAVFFRALFFFWLPLVGFSAEMATSAIVFIGLFQFVTHTRLVDKLGFLEQIFVTPSHHRVHHARNDNYIDRNYGHVFIFWDKFHNTFIPETEEPEFGIITGFESSNPYWAYFFYWTDLYQRSKTIPRFIDKVKLWLMPPAWMPEGSDLVKPVFDLDEEGHRKKYINELPFRLQLYIILNIIPVFISFTHVVANGKTLAPTEITLLISIILATIFALGSLMETKSWAWKVELVRLAYMIVCLPIIFWSYSNGILFSAIAIVFLLFMAFWVVRMRDYMNPEDPRNNQHVLAKSH